jgi:integrase
VLVTVLDAGADAPGTQSPQAVADPALAEGCHPSGRPVCGIAGIESVRGLIPRNACEAVKPPKVVLKEVTPLDQQQAKALLEAASGDRLSALYVLAVHTGMREGELLGLTWDDVDTLGSCALSAT